MLDEFKVLKIVIKRLNEGTIPYIKYIEQWIRRLGIEQLWQEVLSDSGGSDE